jgi:hypothetical protein
MKQKNGPLAVPGRARLSQSVGAVIDHYLHHWTPPKPADAPSKKSNAGAPDAPAARVLASPQPRQTATPPSRALNGALRPLTALNTALPPAEVDKTKPIRATDSPASSTHALSERQLTAARLLVRGQRPARVAAELGITRQALWYWRRTPEFAREVQRLNELLLRAPSRAVELKK